MIRPTASVSAEKITLRHSLTIFVLFAAIASGCNQTATETSAQQPAAPAKGQESPDLVLAKKEIELLKKEIELLKAEIANLRQLTNAMTSKAAENSIPLIRGHVFFRSQSGKNYTLNGQAVYLCDLETHKKIITDYFVKHRGNDAVDEASGNLDQFSSPLRLDLYADYVAGLAKIAAASKISTKTDKDGAYSFSRLPRGTNYVFTTMVVDNAVGFWSVRVPVDASETATLDLDQSNSVKIWERVHQPLR